MAYTLGEAAKATGKSKTSIRRAVDSGRISAAKNDLGEWEIDPAELHRVFPLTEPRNGDAAREVARSVTPGGTPVTPLLAVQLEAAGRERDLLRELLDREREISRGLESDRDHWRKQATALLTDQRKPDPPAVSPQKPAEGRLSRAWGILRGKS